MLTKLAQPLELSVTQSAETASRFERAQGTAWTHLARERGNSQIVKGGHIKVNRDRPYRCIAEKRTEFTGQPTPRSAHPYLRPLSSQHDSRKRSRIYRRRDLAIESEETGAWPRSLTSSLPKTQQVTSLAVESRERGRYETENVSLSKFARIGISYSQ